VGKAWKKIHGDQHSSISQNLGHSPEVINAIKPKTARRGATVCGVVGRNGGKLA